MLFAVAERRVLIDELNFMIGKVVVCGAEGWTITLAPTIGGSEAPRDKVQ